MDCDGESAACCGPAAVCVDRLVTFPENYCPGFYAHYGPDIDDYLSSEEWLLVVGVAAWNIGAPAYSVI